MQVFLFTTLKSEQIAAIVWTSTCFYFNDFFLLEIWFRFAWRGIIDKLTVC